MKSSFVSVHYKQGDDLAHCIDQCKKRDSTDPVADGLALWSDCLRVASEAAAEIAKKIRGKKIEIQADTHMIHLSGDDDVIQELIDLELAYKYDDDEEECEEV